ALTGARAARRSLRARDDEQRSRVRQRDEAARRAEPGGGTSVAARGDPVLHASADQRAHRGRPCVGEQSEECMTAIPYTPFVIIGLVLLLYFVFSTFRSIPQATV